jgi:anti-anti-sigma factor
MLQTELQHVLMELSPRILVIDFRVVRMLSSSPIGVLLKIQQRMRDVEGELRLANVAVPIEEVYRTLGLADSHLPVYDSVQQALAIQSIDGSEEEREMMED